MLKFLFGLLLVANGLLWAYAKGHLGHLGPVDSAVRQPERMANQLNGQQLTLIGSPGASVPAAPAQALDPARTNSFVTDSIVTESPVDAALKPVLPPAAPALACIDIGNFSKGEAARFEARLAPLALGERQSRHTVPGADVANYVVYLPPDGGKDGAEQKVAQLQRLGVQNYFIMTESATLRWAVSLGVFKSETAAQNLQADLVKRGVPGVRIAPRMAAGTLLTFRLRGLGFEARSRLTHISADFPDQAMQDCQ